METTSNEVRAIVYQIEKALGFAYPLNFATIRDCSGVYVQLRIGTFTSCVYRAKSYKAILQLILDEQAEARAYQAFMPMPAWLED